MANESFVRVQEEVRRAATLSGVNSSVLAIGGIVISEAGPADVNLVTSQQQLLDEYTPNGELDANSHPSLIHAYYLLANSSLVLSRSLGSNSIQALTDKGDKLVYIEGNLLIHNTALSITVDTPGDDYSFEYGPYVFYKGVAPVIPANKIGVSVTNFEDVLEFFRDSIEFEIQDEDAVVIDADSLTVGIDSIYDTVTQLANLTITTTVTTIDIDSNTVYDHTMDILVTDILNPYSFKLGTDIFHVGAAPVAGVGETLVPIADFAEFVTLMDSGAYASGFIGTPVVTATTISGVLRSDTLVLENVDNTVVTDASVEVILPGTAFLIVPGSPMSFNKFTAAIDTSGDNPVLNVDGNDYEFSMDTEGTNEFGQNIYIEYINDLTEIDFSIEILDPAQGIETLMSISFGKANVDELRDAEPQNMIKAAQKLVDQEDIRLDILFDMGIAHLALQSTLVNLGGIEKLFVPITIPSTLKTEALVRNYRRSLGVDSPQAYFVANSEETNALLGFKTILSGAALYLERVAINKAGNIEFAPTFHRVNGRVSASKLNKIFKKSERESMLDEQVNTIVFRTSDGLTYINDNVTGQKIKDVMSEEQNRRMANKISRDAVVILEQFIGAQNTAKSRNQVGDIMKVYFDTNILNQEYSIAEYELICDESNNPDALIRDNKLAVTINVRYLNSIKFVEVLHKVFPVGVDFNA